MVEAMKSRVANMLVGMESYEPKNIPVLENYVELQCSENEYDLEANLMLLKLYQLNPLMFEVDIVSQILLKALTNLPNNDFTLCKCLLNGNQLEEEPINQIVYLSTIVEQCEFDKFWQYIPSMCELTASITGFMDSIRKYVCSIVGTTYQRIEKTKLAKLLGNVDDMTLAVWITRYEWKEEEGGLIFIKNQKDIIKPKIIKENIELENVSTAVRMTSSINLF